MTYGRSHRGLVRASNQDGFLIRSVAHNGHLLAVADGIGGGPGGKEASRLALEALDDAVGLSVKDVARLAAAVSLANRRVYETGRQDKALEGMGTTLTTAVLFDDRLLIAHVGDSRAYRIQPLEIMRLTVDHSVAGEMARAGSITPDEAAHHPRRHVLTRAVGPYDKIRVDVQDLVWSKEDRLLLCTDGLSSVISDDEIFVMSQSMSGQQFMDHLIDVALERGGPDNITLVLAETSLEPGDVHGG